MNADTRNTVKALLDFVYDSCAYDSSGRPRPTDEKLQKFAAYIGWLEGNLLAFCTDEQAKILMDRVKIRTKDDAVDEALLHDDQDGSFY
jgi:hypothetical protein